MGCCSSADLQVEAPATLPAGITTLTNNSPAAEVDEFIDLLTLAFAGVKGTRPEATLSWTQGDANAADRETPGDHHSPLTEDPPAAMVDSVRYLMRFLATFRRHGGAFMLRDDAGKLVGACVCIPPNDSNAHDSGTCEAMGIMRKLGPIPASFTNARGVAFEKVMQESHKRHASMQHMYVYCFGTAVDAQGKGHGTTLLAHIAAWSDQLGVPAYLETSGELNTKFYAKHGFEVKERYTITAGGDAAQCGFYAMVRQPVTEGGGGGGSGGISAKVAATGAE